MRKLFAWLGVATLAILISPETARAGDPLKPYVVLVFDTSGSMDDAGSVTGFGPPSCGGNDTRLDHARCAVSKIVGSYGDMVFALTRFRMTMSGTTTANTFPAGCSISGAGNAGTGTCTHLDDAIEVLTPLVDGNNDAANAWVNFSGNTCTATGTDPEIWNGSGNTPLAGSLTGVRQYYSGVATSTNGSTIWPSNLDGFAPIANDPTKLAFLSKPNKPATCNPNPATCDDTANCSSQTNCCCAEQCRPYLVILMTDGDETCSQRCSNNTSQLCLQDSDCGAGSCDINFSPGVSNAAAALLATDVENRRYRIETKAIGFGKPAPDPEIEAIAQAGGATNAPGVNEGFYAQNEEELQLAISTILDDAIKVEKCNGRDDDCDIAVDEDFEPAKGEACNNGAVGQCTRTGILECNLAETGLQCNAQTVTCNGSFLVVNGSVTATPCGEVCNTLDDDCDGKIDENLVGCSCSPQQEQCNGRDDDCDTRVDEASTNGPPLTRPCGTGTCAGVETCSFVANCGPLPGTPGCSGFGGCTAQPSTTETCNGLDDNCDGIRDGLEAACSTMSAVNDPFDSPTNNPGHPSNSPIPENICHPGFKVCPVVAGPPNSFGTCEDEVKPCNNPNNNTAGSCQDLCNGLDDDCDNLIDEDFVPADCSDGCGVGQTVCDQGQLSCDSVAQPGGDNNCNGVDEDCDTVFDEDFACDDATPKPGFPAQCDPRPAKCDPSPNCTGTNCCCRCSCTGAGICGGDQICASGAKLCQGDPISQESCDCSDNNCNNVVDEGNLCAPGSICNEFCQCAFQCNNSEFPCPLGKFCKEETTNCSTAANCDASDACTQDPSRTDCCCRRLCITDPCFGITCDPEEAGDCTTDAECDTAAFFGCAPSGKCVKKMVCQPNAAGNASSCVAACDPSVVNCDPLICLGDTGQCAPNDCTTFPELCQANQNCVNGTCVTNLCQGVTCPSDQYCVGGNCIESCADVECPAGERCRLGECEDDPCDAPCPFGQACNDNSGQCVPDGCGSIDCPQGQWCNPNNNGGTCEDDPCVGTQCPSTGEVCLGGTCYDPADLAPDGGVEVRVTAGGGGCSTSGGDAGWLLLGVALLFVRPRRERKAPGGRS